ncbi:MAG: hypothetical protein C4558_02530 [Dehalococcoidia bacterium]|nr:MAG: hypothetical protein C4558_02530 [Dehalococcoidia bacterium]
MSVSPSVLLLSISIGGPVLLLALAVLYHSALISRQQLDLESVLAQVDLSPSTPVQRAAPATFGMRESAVRDTGVERDLLNEHVSSLVTRSADALAERLEQAMAQMQEQLTQQRTSLEMLLSEPPRTLATAGASLGRAAGEHIHAESALSMSDQIARLIDDGLSDRAIARELRVGLEEVKIARSRGGHA